MNNSIGVMLSPRDPISSDLAPATPVQGAPSVKATVKRKTTRVAKKIGDEDNETKKRVRLKPETREQLLDRLRNPQLSLHEASILLRVSRATVRRYADSSRLPCERTSGGQRRFYLRDIETFYRQSKKK